MNEYLDQRERRTAAYHSGSKSCFPHVLLEHINASSNQCNIIYFSLFGKHWHSVLIFKILKYEFHRITQLFELDGTFKGQLVQLPCYKQGHLQLDHVAQSPTLECLQEQSTYQFPGQPIPVPRQPSCKKLLPSIQSTSPLLSLNSFPFVLLQQTLLKLLSPSFLLALFEILKGLYQVSLEPSFLWAEHAATAGFLGCKGTCGLATH